MKDRQLSAYRTLVAALVTAKVVRERAVTSTPVGQLLEDYWMASLDTIGYLDTKVARLERTLRLTLASDALDENQRAGILSAVYGPAGPDRDPKLLTDTERQMIEDYRRMDVANRTMVRSMVRNLTAKEGNHEGQ